ncbi:glycosyltransferase family 4 protein [Desulfovibrio sp. OttesenSCG-928-A18]|nr:glycosyltransferase family 4 protein [Desulfovibrio sp. OttesenSCG-928-A18]
MKITITCSSMTVSRGGAERVAAWLANSLVGLGHELVIYARDEQRGQPVYPLDKRVALKFYSALVFPEEKRLLREELLLEKPDVHVVFYWDDEPGHWLGALDGTGIPLVLSERNSPSFLEERSWTRLGRLTALAGADIIHLLFARSLGSLPENLHERVTIIGNPVVSVQAPAHKKKSGKRGTIMCASRLKSYKQQVLLVDAFCLLHEQFPDWRLEIWGKGGEKKILEKKISEHKLEDKILLCGFTQEIEDRYPEADIYCIPSRYEGFPNVLLEALSRGLPCVGFARCPGVNSLIRDGYNGCLAPEMTAQSLAEKLSLLMGDAELRDRMSENAVASVREYAEGAVLDKWVAMLQGAAGISPTSLQRIKSAVPDYESHLAALLEDADFVSARRVKKALREAPSFRRRCSRSIRRALHAVTGLFSGDKP